MSRSVIAALELSALSLLGGCLGGGDTALTTVPTAHLAITLPATTVIGDTPFTFTVTAVDAANVVVPTYIGTVHITTSDASAKLPGDATLARGVGSFTVTFYTTGSQTITASDTVGDATSGTSPAVSVTPIPAPTVTSLSPTQAFAGGSGFTLTVNGSNLEPNSVVQWNGSNRSTAFVNGSQVTAQISAADIAMAGAAAVTVFNPGPGGGSSNTVTFTITRHLTMTTARAEDTATLLPDGKVLIAGGFGDGSAALASAELYDPATGTFTRTGDMTVARARHTAVLLNDGNVLIAGGSTGLTLSPDLASAEIYEPSTGAFTATGKMITGCCVGWGLSALLPDGRVFIATDGIADIYDPGSGAFTSTGPYVEPSYVLYATALLPDGRVLLVGVVDSAGTAGTSQLFDPKTNTFSPTGGRACSDCVSTATLLSNGQVLFVEAGDGVSDFAEIYDPASGTFINVGRTLDSQVFSTATRLSDGTVLIAGGQLPGSATPAGNPAVELYAPATSTFAPAASLSTGRYSHTATLLADGTVLIAGGYSAWRQPTANAEIYK